MMAEVKMEDAIGSSSFPSSGYNPLSSVFDFCDVDKGSLGFMELLGVQDYHSPPPLDSPKVSVAHNSDLKEGGKECSEVLNQQPPTPNSSSISSASSEALHDEHNKTVDQGTEHQKTKKQWVITYYYCFLFILPFCVYLPKPIFVMREQGCVIFVLCSYIVFTLTFIFIFWGKELGL